MERRAFAELPYHLISSHTLSSKELDETLCSLDFVRVKCAFGLTFDLLQDYHDMTNVFADAKTPKQAQTALTEFRTFLSSNAHIISQQPHLLFQQAANQPDTSKPAVRE